MANYRLTDKSALNENPASDDKLMLVDTSDTSSSSAGTSKQIDNKFLIQTDKLVLSNANIQALDNTGSAGAFQVLVDTSGSGFSIIPLSIAIFVTYASSTESSNSNLYVGFDPTSTSSYWTYFNRFMNGVPVDVPFIQATPTSSTAGVGGTTTDNTRLHLYASNNFNGGWSATVYTTYTVIKL